MEAMRRIRWTRALQLAIGFSTLLWTGDALASSAIVSAITSACAGKTMTVSVTDCALCHGSAFTTVNPSNMYWSDAQSGFYDSFCAASTTGTGTTADTGTTTDTGGTTASTDTGSGTTAGSVFDDEDEIDRRFSRPTRTARGGGDDGSDDVASAGDDAGSTTSGSSDSGASRSDARGDNGRGTEQRTRSRHWSD